MSYVIDRRLNGKNKSTVNRHRFLVGATVNTSRRPSRRPSKPRSHYRHGARRADQHSRALTSTNRCCTMAAAGRQDRRPPRQQGIHRRRAPPPAHPAGGGRGGGKASTSGEGMDADFVFQITQEEFLDFMFEDLSRPTRSSATSPAPTPSRPSARHQQRRQPARASTSSAPCASTCAAHCAVRRQMRAKLRAALKELERIKREEPDNLGDIQELELKSPSSARASPGAVPRYLRSHVTTCWSAGPTPPPRR
ncbi:DUF444 family protein [Pseudomonas aeruginosa]